MSWKDSRRLTTGVAWAAVPGRGQFRRTHADTFASLLFGILLSFIVNGHATQATLVPLTGVTLLRAGEGSYALAVRQDGVLLGWGANTQGTLGNGTTDPSLTPSQVLIPGGAADVVALAPSAVFALALKAPETWDSQKWC